MTLTYYTQPNDTVKTITPVNGVYTITDTGSDYVSFMVRSAGGNVTMTERVHLSEPNPQFIESVTDYTNNGSGERVQLAAGTYMIECWGGQGNNVKYRRRYSDDEYNQTQHGGYGGYTQGTITFSTTTTVFVHVGVGGETVNNYSYTVDNISCVTQSTSENWNYVLICAGGGGCPTIQDNSGTVGTYSSKPGQNAVSAIPSPTPASSLKLNGATGGRVSSWNTGYEHGGGGDGYYGGVAGNGTSTSSYIGGAGGCNYIKNTMSSTVNKSGSESFLSPEGVTETGHTGAAHIRITKYKLDLDNVVTVNSKYDCLLPRAYSLTYVGNQYAGTHTLEFTGVSELIHVCEHKTTNIDSSAFYNIVDKYFIFDTDSYYIGQNVIKPEKFYNWNGSSWDVHHDGCYIKADNTWHTIEDRYTNVNGLWKTYHPSASEITFTHGTDVITPLNSFCGTTIVPPNDGTIEWKDSDGNIVTQGYVVKSYDETLDGGVPIPVYEFPFIGNVYVNTLSAGTYKLECWGAQGGTTKTSYPGGLGGYCCGTLTLSENTNIYVYTGEQGKQSGTTFNVGYTRSLGSYCRHGGGASDIRIGTDSLYSRVIVAGGGGGASYYSTSSYSYGGYGGGLTGGDGTSRTNEPNAYGRGGTQIAGGINGHTANGHGSFGCGGCSSYSNNSGGGGGWYGGGGGCRSSGDGCEAGGGGGSAWAYNATNYSTWLAGNPTDANQYLLTSNYYLTDINMKAGNETFKSPTNVNETGHTGNGYVRITKIA